MGNTRVQIDILCAPRDKCLTKLCAVLCAYLEGDLTRIRASIVLGSVVPLLTLLVWDAIALGLSNGADQVSDPVELLLRLVYL